MRESVCGSRPLWYPRHRQPFGLQTQRFEIHQGGGGLVCLGFNQQDARTRSMLAGNYSERALVLQDKGDLQGALESMGCSGSCWCSIPKACPRVFPWRPMRAAWPPSTPPERKHGKLRKPGTVRWVSMTTLQRGGYLGAPDVKKDSEKAHAEEARLAAQRSPGRSAPWSSFILGKEIHIHG